jgi:GTP cyclohydrolase I
MKKDPILGKTIGVHLRENDIETPFCISEQQVAARETIANSFTKIMQCLGLDLDDDSLKDSPFRVADMYMDEIFSGLNYDNFPKCTTVENKMGYDEMVIVTGINVSSNCEHHFVAIDGVAKIAYIPKKKVLGLSKFNRITNFFSRRPQIQERLTEQIYHALSYVLDTDDIAVEIVATHHCVKSRGVMDGSSLTTTRKLGGCFMDTAVRAEFLNSK